MTLHITKEIYNILLLKLVKLKMVSVLLLRTMIFNLQKILPMNLEVVIIFKEQISKLYILAANLLTLFSMDFFGAAHGWGEAKKAPLYKICHTYPTMMKLGKVLL